MAKAKTDSAEKRPQRCGTMDVHRRLAARDPEYRRRRRQIEIETRQFIARFAAEGLRTSVVRIPVVVHVVWNNVEQNISDAQIRSQIESLNKDFRRTNSDAANVPAYFAGVSADSRIEFALAVRDPNCGPTNGITRTHTTMDSFTAESDSIKSAATGGADPWPSDRYLNIWIAPKIYRGFDELLGYGSFPGTLAAIDGVVIVNNAFGTVGILHPNYNLGRTATHEIGHWLNLLHIWGPDDDSSTSCLDSDECADTPNQDGANYGVPLVIPVPVSCGNGPNGDMYMNYMDYTDDIAMFMFTQDQATRMNAALMTARSSILASDGLTPVIGTPQASDLWMRDNADDIGAEPSASTLKLSISDDIWVRRSADGFINQDHQNPNAEQTCHVYVRVRNRGCAGAPAQSGTLKIYWAKASTSLRWPKPWDGSVTQPVLMGGSIGQGAIAVSGGEVQIYHVPWTPPDPSDYAAIAGNKAHFCLLARIETSPNFPFGMTSPETQSLHGNVRNNNNIVWKNISIVDTDGVGAHFADVVIGTIDIEIPADRLRFQTPPRNGFTLFDWGHILVEFRGDALRDWANGSIAGNGFVRLDDGRLFISRDGAEIVLPRFGPRKLGTVHVQFVPDGRRNTGAQVFELDMMELDAGGEVLGGQRFLLKTTSSRKRLSLDTQLGTFDGVDWDPKKSCSCGPDTES